MPKSPIYEPVAPWIKDSWISKFITSLGFDSEEELWKFSIQDPEEFWTRTVADMGLKFSTPPHRMLVQGLPWPEWAKGGQISVVENCIDRHLKESSKNIALRFESDEPGRSTEWTFEDLARESSFVTEELMRANAKPGDRAALLMPMSLEMVASFFGIMRAGLTAIPIFSGYGADAVASRLNDAQVKFVFLQKSTTRRGKEVNVRASLDEALKTSSSVTKIFEWDREAFLKGHRDQKIIPSHIDAAESECLLLYTSGTTGKPKGCVHTRFGILATCGKELRYGFDVHPSDRFFWYTDIGWMMGPWELIGVLQYGASVVLYEGVPDHPNASRLWDILETHKVTHLGISPTAIRVLKKLESSGPDKYDFKNLRILGSTGEPWDEESWIWFFKKVGKSKCPIMNISGGTEIMGCLLMPSPLQRLKPCSLGRPALGVHAEAWSEEGERLENGLGHLVCLSPLPSMTKGFLGNPQKYLDTYFEKFGEKVWYHGDWASIDEDGFWFLRGRSDDTIKIAGKRVGPSEFESALMQDSHVAEVAAVGIPHEIKGESVYCYVVLKTPDNQSDVLRASLLKLASQKMGKALAPEKILFVDALPKTRSGKILRGIIRKIQLKEKFDDANVENAASLKAIEQAR